MTEFQSLSDIVRADTLRWVQRAVLGLNLCPFAHEVVREGQLHCAVSAATSSERLQADLAVEIAELRACPVDVRETTVLVAPLCLRDFLDFNDFLDQADALIDTLGLRGEIQIASFHPAYQFARTRPGDITNCTNRAPYPTLHILREASIAGAVASVSDTASIFKTNQARLRELGRDGWNALDVGPTAPPELLQRCAKAQAEHQDDAALTPSRLLSIRAPLT